MSVKTKKIKLSKLQALVAERLASAIQEQDSFLKSQAHKLDDALLQGSSNGYDLRQTIQYLESCKATLSHLISTFETYVGVDYETYCESVKETAIPNPVDKLLKGIESILKDMIK